MPRRTDSPKERAEGEWTIRPAEQGELPFRRPLVTASPGAPGIR
jgi:hypothetical protein